MKKLRGMFVLGVICAGIAFAANVEGEKEALGRILVELEAVQSLIADAERQANTSGRIKFNYASLRADLKTVVLGIEKYRAGQFDSPREIDALVGDYRR